MPVDVIMPKVDMDMATGTVVTWHAKAGDVVKKGAPLFDIETDKATMEIESPADGVLGNVTAEKGAVVPIGNAIAKVFLAGETPTLDKAVTTSIEQLLAMPAVIKAPLQFIETPKNATVIATPLAKRLARERSIDLKTVKGSGPRGRIFSNDLPAQKASAANANANAIHLAMSCDITNLLQLQNRLQSHVKDYELSLDSLLARALGQSIADVLALPKISVGLLKPDGDAVLIVNPQHTSLAAIAKVLQTTQSEQSVADATLLSFIGFGIEHASGFRSTNSPFTLTVGDPQDATLQFTLSCDLREMAAAVKLAQSFKRILEEPTLLLA